MLSFIKSALKHLRLLPVLILVASAAFAMRLGEVVTDLRTMSGAAEAAEALEPAAEKAAGKAETKADAKAEDDAKAETVVKDTTAPPDQATLPVNTSGAAAATKPEIDAPSLKEPDIKEGDWHDATETDIDYSTVPDEIFKDIEKRRANQDKRDSELQKREALLKAAESELNRKYDELSKLRGEIEGLLNKQSEQEEARLKSLVKIYEGMKPKDAARIFNTLDMDVLLEVIGRMSERKSAPIIAEMDAERAQSLTLMLADQKKLPGMPEEETTLAPSTDAAASPTGQAPLAGN